MPEHDAASVSDVVPMGAHSHRWTLGLKQSSFGPIARDMQRAVLDASGRPLFSWHALVPSRFRVQVSQLTQERSFKFFPTALGIQRSASRRTPSVLLSQAWTADPERCRQARLPALRRLATEPQRARQMLARACTVGVPAPVGTAASVDGTNRRLRLWVEA
jgi:hypothetical protein